MGIEKDGTDGRQTVTWRWRPWHTTRQDGPSWRPVLTAVLTAVMTAGKTGRVSGVPSELKIFPKKHCSAMLFRLTGRQDGSCDRPLSRLQKKQHPSWRPSWRDVKTAVKTGRVSGALPLDEASVKKLHRFLRAGCFCHTTGSVKVLTEAHSTDLTQRPEMAVCCSGNALVSINKVNLRWAWLVLGWVTVSGFDSRRRHFISDCNQPPRSTQPSTLRGTVKWVPAKGQWCSVARELRQAWCNLQVKLCDPCLSALEVVTTMRYTNGCILLLMRSSERKGLQTFFTHLS